MAYYDALAAKWATLTGTTDEKIAAANALTLPGPAVDVAVSAIEGALGLAGSLTAIEDWLDTSPPLGEARTSAKELMRTIVSPHVMTFQTSKPEVLATLTAMLGSLVAVVPPLLASEQVNALLAMAQTTVPWWGAPTEDGGAGLSGPVSETDLQPAGDLT